MLRSPRLLSLPKQSVIYRLAERLTISNWTQYGAFAKPIVWVFYSGSLKKPGF
jgi:hypothetical protein